MSFSRSFANLLPLTAMIAASCFSSHAQTSKLGAQLPTVPENLASEGHSDSSAHPAGVPSSESSSGVEAVPVAIEFGKIPVLAIPRTASRPTLDQFITGKLTGGAAKITDFRQRSPGDGIPVSQSTTAYLSYDDQNLYAVFICQDDPSRVRAHLGKRDNITNDDQVFLYLDTFRDRQHAYVFSANPVGIQADGVFTEGQTSIDYSFDATWSAEGRLTKDGYVILMSIPFGSLRFSSRNRAWGIALQRTIAKTNEQAFWPYITNKTAGFLQQFGELDGLETVSPVRNIQMIPYTTYTYARTLDSSQTQLDTVSQLRAGMDTKVGLAGNALALDATLNPDFSQVESDDPQVTVNQRYQVYFPEKRPFFLENASFFQTPIDLFFSRTIVDPEFGTRLTGTLGNWNLGVLASDDRDPGQQIGGDDALTGTRSADSVVSVHREFGNQSVIGGMVTNFDFGASHNHLFSFDTRLRLSSNWFLTGQFVKDYDQEPGSISTQGQAYLFDLKRTGRSFSYEGTYSDFSPNFAAPLGFIKRVDIIKIDQNAGYLWYPEKGPLVDYGPFVAGSIDWDHQSVLQDWNAGAGVNLDFKNSSGLRLSHYETFERYLDVPFRYYKNELYYYFSWRRWLDLYGTVDQGTGVNYEPAPGLLPFSGDTVDAALGLTFRPASRVRLDETYYYDVLTRPGSPVVYTNHIIQTKLNYQFTRRLSVRAIVDYYVTLPNSALIDLTRFKQVTGDLLLTYMLNPGTALYVGYNNQHQNLAILPGTPPSAVPSVYQDYPTNSQLFIKASYLFHF